MRSQERITAAPTRAVILLLVCVSSVQSAPQSGNTCPGIETQPVVSLQHCRYLQQPDGDVQCDVLLKNEASTAAVHVRVTLALIATNASHSADARNPIPWCLGVSAVAVDKIEVNADWPNVTVVELPLLAQFEQLRVRASFDPQVPLGFLNINPECVGGIYTWPSSCIKSIHLLEEFVKPKINSTRISTAEFWEKLKKPYLQKWKLRVPIILIKLNGHGLPYDLETILQAAKYALKDTGVHQLYLGGLSVEDLPPVLPPLPELKELDLSGNGIRTIHPDNFGNVPYLTSLNLSKNSFYSLPDELKNLKMVQELNLSYNPSNISVNLASTLLHMTGLKWLCLSGVPLKNLAVLQPLLSEVKLLGLDLSKCKLSLDSDSIFDQQTSLAVLDLSGNGLKTIPSRLFVNLHNLARLHLGDNSLTVAPRLLLSGNKRLELLDLSKNILTKPSGILEYGSVHTLDVSGNAITDWIDTDSFSKPTSWVKEVNLSYNLIESVSRKMGASMDVLQAVDLGGNFLNCANCNTAAFQTWLLNANVPVLNLGYITTLKCASPSTDIGKPVINITSHVDPCYSDLNNKVQFSVLLLILAAIIIIVLVTGIFIYRAKMQLKNNTIDYYDAYVIYSSNNNRSWATNTLKARLHTSGLYRLYLQDGDTFLQNNPIPERIGKLVHHSSAVVVILSIGFLYNQSCCRLLEEVNKITHSGRQKDFIFIELEPLDQQMLPSNLRRLMNRQNVIQWDVQGETAWGILISLLDSSIAKNRRHIEHYKFVGEKTPLLSVT